MAYSDWEGRASAWCLGAVIVLAPLSSSWVPVPILPGLYPSDLAVGLGMLLWTIRHWRRPDWPLSLPSMPVLAGLGGLILTGVAGAPTAPDPGLTLDLSLRILIALGVICWVTDLAPMPQHMARALVLSSAIEGMVATAQFVAGRSIGLGLIGEIPFGPDLSGGARSFGLTPHPNILGGTASIGVLAGVGLVVLRSRLQIGSLLLLAIASSAVAASLSRSAFLGLGVGLMIASTLARYDRDRRTRLRIALVLIGSVFLLFILARPRQYAQRTVGVLSSSASTPALLSERADLEQRIAQHAVAFALIESNPVLGVGMGNFMNAWHRISATPTVPILPVHDVPILICAEQGILGLAAWCLVQWGIVRQAMRSWPLAQSGWAAVWLAALALVAVVGFFDFYFWEWEQGRVLWSVVLGMWESSRVQDGY